MLIFGEERPRTALSLARYAQLIGYSECAFFGVAAEDQVRYACRDIWTQEQRDEVLNYIEEAERDIEEILEYKMKPTWITEERHVIRALDLTNWTRLIRPGIRATSELSTDALVVHGLDGISTVTVVLVGLVFSVSEVKIFYPGTDLEIIPSNITWDAGTSTLTVSIPRCRLVQYDLRNNPIEGLIYTDLSNFQDTVDLTREYTDDSTQISLISYTSLCTSFCAETSENVCMRIENAEFGKIRLNPYSSSLCNRYSYAEYNYLCGLEHLDRSLESMIIRLAHARMPAEPCGCNVTQRLWARDRNIPKIVTRERVDCPLGMEDGAWYAWRQALNKKIYRLRSLSGPYRG